MIPVKLTLKNFGPFVEETIEFDRFQQQSLFLISGKTGAGKTTIFDGMCYALYGVTSGDERQGKEMRSAFAQPDSPTEVTFTFEHQQHTYQLKRTPEQELLKKRGPGTRVQPSKISLKVYDASGKELQEYSKTSEVAALITELLHLNAKQFAQIVLLPQGDFRAFLTATSDNKEQLLRNLFGTDFYRQWSEWLKNEAKQTHKQLEAVMQRLQGKLDQTELALPGVTVAEQLLALEQAQAIHQEQLAHLKAEQLTRFQAMEAAQQVLQQAERLTEWYQEQSQRQAQQAQLELLRPEQEQRLERIKELEWAGQQEALLAKTTESRLAVTKRQATVANLLEKLPLAQAVVAEKTASLAKLQEQETEMQAQKNEAQRLQELLPRFQQQTILLEQQRELQQAAARDQQLLATLAITGPTNQELAQAQTNVYAAREQEQEVARMAEKWQALAQQRDQWQQAVTGLSKTPIATVKKQLVQQRQRAAEAELEKAKQQSAWAQAQIARLAKDLLPGTACPLCGSLEHPQPAVATEVEEQTEAHFQQAEAAWQAATAEVARLETQYANLKVTYEEKSRELARQQTAWLAEWRDFKKRYPQLQSEPAELQAELQAQLHTAEKTQQAAAVTLLELEQAADRAQAQEAQRQELTERSQQRTLQLAQLAGELKSLATQLPPTSQAEVLAKVTALQATYQKWQQAYAEAQQTLQEASATATRLEVEITAEQKELTAALVTKELQEEKVTAVLNSRQLTETTLQSWLTALPQLPELREAAADYQQQVALTNQRLAELQQKIAQQPQPELAPLEAAVTTARNLWQEQQERYLTEKNRYDRNQRIFEEVSAGLAANQAEWAQMAELQQLADVASGNNPLKTGLERYVLQAYLQEVLRVANQRLGQLTHGRYQFLLNAEAGSYKNQSGLEIDVYDDNAGASRSAHTLSGGESFIAALALALALAEVIQAQAGGAAIEALFIDEGFGSLDEESLEMAMEALESIETEGRMIGIISHVRELKERIPQQLQVITSGTGQSRVEYKV